MLTNFLSIFFSFFLLSSAMSFENSIRIGTTFDYPPFSYLDKNGQMKGIDIELAQSFAKSQNLRPVFIKTTWKTLSQDLINDKFDLALSGISKTNKRSTEGHQGIGYIRNGKMGISKCKDVNKYSTIFSIDHLKTKVITNAGGTNELFAKKHFKKARIIIHQDNKTVFQEIIQGRADIMITDSVEVRYQVRKNKGVLCSTMKSPLTNGVITYFAQASKKLKLKLDNWFKLIEKNGFKNKIIRKYL